MSSYDLVLFPCEGGPNNLTNAAKQTLTTYANLGGRVFATHYSYVWPDIPPFSGTAVWGYNQGAQDYRTHTGFIDTSFATGAALARCLQLVRRRPCRGRSPFRSSAMTSTRWSRHRSAGCIRQAGRRRSTTRSTRRQDRPPPITAAVSSSLIFMWMILP